MTLILYFRDGRIERHEKVKAIQGDAVQIMFTTRREFRLELDRLITFQVEP